MSEQFSRRHMIQAGGIITTVGTAGCLRLQGQADSGDTEQENIIELSSQWEQNVGLFLAAADDFYSGIRSVTRIAPDGTTIFSSDEISDSHHLNILQGKGNALFADESGVYIGADTDSQQGGLLYAFEPTSGEQRWVVEEPGDGYHNWIRAPTRVDDLILYTSHGFDNDNNQKSAVRAVDLETGRRAWDIEFDSGGVTHLLPTENYLFAEKPEGGLRKYNLDTREPLNSWDQNMGLRDFVAEDAVIYTSVGLLQAIDINSGETLWSVEPEREINTRPSIGTNAVFYATESGYIEAYDKGSGDRLWETRVPGTVMNPLQYANGVVWAGTRRGELFAFGEESGTQYYADQLEPDFAFVISGDILLESVTNTAYKINNT